MATVKELTEHVRDVMGRGPVWTQQSASVTITLPNGEEWTYKAISVHGVMILLTAYGTPDVIKETF